uniref:Punein (Fragments) n=1 Tax=Punica granatum TaxID=22663 RepID=PUN_PUNGR|nr:RecName: Full=Punein [Punica granatum]
YHYYNPEENHFCATWDASKP